MPDRTASGVISNDSCDASAFNSVASLTFGVYASYGVVRFQLDVLDPGFFFCWGAGVLTFTQGGMQVQVSLFSGPGRAVLHMDDGADDCTRYPPGVRVTGSIDQFPPTFDVAASFTAVFDHTFCAPRWCGVCTLEVP